MMRRSLCDHPVWQPLATCGQEHLECANMAGELKLWFYYILIEINLKAHLWLTATTLNCTGRDKNLIQWPWVPPLCQELPMSSLWCKSICRPTKYLEAYRFREIRQPHDTAGEDSVPGADIRSRKSRGFREGSHAGSHWLFVLPHAHFSSKMVVLTVPSVLSPQTAGLWCDGLEEKNLEIYKGFTAHPG